MSTTPTSADQSAAPAVARCRLSEPAVIALQAAVDGKLIRSERKYPHYCYISGDTNVRVRPNVIDVLFQSCLIETGTRVGDRRPLLATKTGRAEAAARRGADGQRVPAFVDLSEPQQRALSVVDTLQTSVGVTLATLRANGVRRDVLDRLCKAKLIFVAGGEFDGDRIRYAVHSNGSRVLATA